MTPLEIKESFVLIKLSVVILTFKRDDDLKEALSSISSKLCDVVSEYIIVDNDSGGVERLGWLKNIFPNLILVNPPTNLGVAAGRNLGASVAREENIFFFDDDAVLADDFDSHDFLGNIDGSKLLASNCRRIGGGFVREEFPFFDKSRPREQDALCARFIGVAHVIPKEHFLGFGGYDSESFYGMEELHLAAWCLAKSKPIVYLASFRVVHKKSDLGRLPRSEELQKIFRNKLVFLCEWYSLLLLPPLVAINGFFFWRRGLALGDAFRVIKRVIPHVFVCSSKISMSDRCSFLKSQFKIGDFLI